MAEGGEPLEFTEEEHRHIQAQFNEGVSEDEEFKKRDPVVMRKKAGSLDVLFQGPNIRAFFNQRSYSHIAWATLIVLLITILLLLVTMTAPGWGWTREISGGEIREGEMYGKYGLWYLCWELVEDPGTYVDCEFISVLGVPGWFHGVQAMTVLSLIASIVAFANSAAYICAKSLNMNSMLITSVVIFSCSGAVFAITAFVVFAIEFLQEAYWCCKNGVMEVVDWHFYYCFYICCAVPAFHMAAAILASMEVARLRSVDRKLRYAAELDEKRQSGNYEGYHYPYNMGAAYGYGYGYGQRPPPQSYSGYGKRPY